jgi:hypothetical protein
MAKDLSLPFCFFDALAEAVGKEWVTREALGFLDKETES